jgi:ribosomal protein L15
MFSVHHPDMKLWMLVPTKKGFNRIKRTHEDATVIVRADTEIAARNLAQHSTKIANVAIWTNSEFSICDELPTNGDAAVIVWIIAPSE